MQYCLYHFNVASGKSAANSIKNVLTDCQNKCSELKSTAYGKYAYLQNVS